MGRVDDAIQDGDADAPSGDAHRPGIVGADGRHALVQVIGQSSVRVQPGNTVQTSDLKHLRGTAVDADRVEVPE